MGHYGSSRVIYKGRAYKYCVNRTPGPEHFGRTIVDKIPRDPQLYAVWLTDLYLRYDNLDIAFESKFLTVNPDNATPTPREVDETLALEESLYWVPHYGAYHKPYGDETDWEYTIDLERMTLEISGRECSSPTIYALNDIPRDWMQQAVLKGELFRELFMEDECHGENNGKADYGDAGIKRTDHAETEARDAFYLADATQTTQEASTGVLPLELTSQPPLILTTTLKQPKDATLFWEQQIFEPLIREKLFEVFHKYHKSLIEAPFEFEDIPPRQIFYAILCLASCSDHCTTQCFRGEIQVDLANNIKESHSLFVRREPADEALLQTSFFSSDLGPITESYWFEGVFVFSAPPDELINPQSCERTLARAVHKAHVERHRTGSVRIILTSFTHIILVKVLPGYVIERTELMPLTQCIDLDPTKSNTRRSFFALVHFLEAQQVETMSHDFGEPLPIEIISQILEYIDYATWKNCLSVSTPFRFLCQKQFRIAPHLNILRCVNKPFTEDVSDIQWSCEQESFNERDVWLLFGSGKAFWSSFKEFYVPEITALNRSQRGNGFLFGCCIALNDMVLDGTENTVSDLISLRLHRPGQHDVHFDCLAEQLPQENDTDLIRVSLRTLRENINYGRTIPSWGTEWGDKNERQIAYHFTSLEYMRIFFIIALRVLTTMSDDGHLTHIARSGQWAYALPWEHPVNTSGLMLLVKGDKSQHEPSTPWGVVLTRQPRFDTADSWRQTTGLGLARAEAHIIELCYLRRKGLPYMLYPIPVLSFIGTRMMVHVLEEKQPGDLARAHNIRYITERSRNNLSRYADNLDEGIGRDDGLSSFTRRNGAIIRAACTFRPLLDRPVDLLSEAEYEKITEVLLEVLAVKKLHEAAANEIPGTRVLDSGSWHEAIAIANQKW